MRNICIITLFLENILSINNYIIFQRQLFALDAHLEYTDVSFVFPIANSLQFTSFMLATLILYLKYNKKNVVTSLNIDFEIFSLCIYGGLGYLLSTFYTLIRQLFIIYFYTSRVDQSVHQELYYTVITNFSGFPYFFFIVGNLFAVLSCGFSIAEKKTTQNNYNNPMNLPFIH